MRFDQNQLVIKRKEKKWKKRGKSLPVRRKLLPLHSQTRNEFFEQIYIDREEVVQEESAPYSLGKIGKDEAQSQLLKR